MKKSSLFLLICSSILFSACSSDKQAAVTDSSSAKQETVNSSSKEKESKEAAEKKKVKEAEEKKQEEISKKVIEADAAMKVAEKNPTDETLAAAKAAIENIPGGNTDLSKRFDQSTVALDTIKRQAQINQKSQQQEPNQTIQQQEPQRDSNGSVIITGAPPITEEEQRTRQALQDETNRIAAENGIDNTQKQNSPPTHVDDQGRQYWHQDNSQFEQ
ncbi:hypothetical protein P7E02_15135 [Enterococcus hulanensis]|uniref:hypothetical protein n=1 Tax=Enterococcus hulanensis TaxID=2559929 RepID=UPI0028919B4D|nr:hypothetical protein [Enterococcus hulanensis]MDT2661207.1 hypothetical protein [Enterococcus hulanensis]